jgi:predicted enzyme related to lactoylglutathione lyase
MEEQGLRRKGEVMPVISSFPQGTFCWIELATSDRDAAKAFYTKLFGWTTNEVPMEPGNPYVLLQKNGTKAAALYKRRDDNIPPHWATYVAVDSTDASAEKVKSLGGNIVAGPFDVMDMGRMAFATDPQGASFALWQNLKPGELIVGETGTLCWNELMTTDAEGARKFYTELFGWTAKVSPEYTEWHLNGRGIGGLLERLPPGAPPHWIPYFAVDDTDKFVDDLKSLGGKVYMGPADIPNAGRFAVVADPQGADFAVIKVQM